MPIGNGASRGPLRMVLATDNRDKAAEIEVILRHELGERLDLVARPDSVPEVEETGDTLEENARLKAQALLDATGLAAVADDTGLEVDALDGAPGVYSSRFSGEHATYAQNVAKLLDDMRDVPDERRTAQFVTVAIAAFPGGQELVGRGVVHGRIATEKRGDHGFGYDPVFVPDDGDGRTFAQMEPAEKHAISHRGRAFRALAVGLRNKDPMTL
ncbi:MAG: RdgB/HAM1 family non-canonical purine NTP pyrophosphatase [Acidimicrobiales bacterium]